MVELKHGCQLIGIFKCSSLKKLNPMIDKKLVFGVPFCIQLVGIIIITLA